MIAKCNIHIAVSPKIDKLPEEIEAVVFDNVTLECISSGYPRPEIRWFQGEEVVDELNSYTSITYHAINDTTVSSIIHWRHIRSTASGVYVCLATNNIGSMADSVELTILGKVESLYSATFYNPFYTIRTSTHHKHFSRYHSKYK